MHLSLSFRVLILLWASLALLPLTQPLVASPFQLHWTTWTDVQVVNGRMNDTGPYTYSQGYDLDPGFAGVDIVVTITEVFGEDLVNNGNTLEFRFDHIGDQTSFDANGNVTFGPYIPNPVHEFGVGNTDAKLKVVFRDYSKKRNPDGLDPIADPFGGYVEVKLTFPSYENTLFRAANVVIPIFDVDWRGSEGAGNNEQDRITNVVAKDINGNVISLIASFTPWGAPPNAPAPTPANTATNSFIVLTTANGDIDQIISGQPHVYNNIGAQYILDPDGTAYPLNTLGRTPGFNSYDSQGWGNLVLSTPPGVAVSEVSYRWGTNPREVIGAEVGGMRLV